jgi:hypothetical protein
MTYQAKYKARVKDFYICSAMIFPGLAVAIWADSPALALYPAGLMALTKIARDITDLRTLMAIDDALIAPAPVPLEWPVGMRRAA